MPALTRSWSWRLMHMRIDRHFPILLLGVVLIALALRLVASVLFANFNPGTAELWEYGEIARHAVTQGWMGRAILGPDGFAFTAPTAYMPPGYVFVWIAAFKLFGVTSEALVAVTALNIACGLLIVWMTARLAQALTGDSLVALLAAGLVAIYPTFIYSVVTYHALNAYTAVFLAALLLIIRQVRDSAPLQLVAIGVLGGAAALLRSEFVLFMGVIYIVFWWMTGRTKEFAVMVLLSTLVVAPWTVRNYVVFERVIPIASSAGYNLWKGHNPEASGSGDEIEKIGAAKRQLGGALAAVPRDDNYEIAYDQVFRDAALAYIRANPLETLVLGIKKNLLFWVWEMYDPISWKPAYLVPHVLTSVLAFAGIVLAFRQGASRAAVFIIALAVVQSLINAAFSVHVRYRMTAEPILFIYAALAAVAVLKAWWHRETLRGAAEVVELPRPAVSAD